MNPCLTFIEYEHVELREWENTLEQCATRPSIILQF